MRLKRLYDAIEAGVADLDDPALKERIAGLKGHPRSGASRCRPAQALLDSPRAIPEHVCALRFFYGVTLGHAGIPERIDYARSPRTLPVVLGADEVVRFLEAVPSLKTRTALTTAYAPGLRASETVGLNLRVSTSAVQDEKLRTIVETARKLEVTVPAVELDKRELDRDGCIVNVGGGRMEARQVVLATNVALAGHLWHLPVLRCFLHML